MRMERIWWDYSPPCRPQLHTYTMYITTHKLIIKLGVIDNDELILRERVDSKWTREHSMKLRKGPKGHRETAFHRRVSKTWNNLTEAIITATSVHQLKKRQDKNRNRNRATPDSLEPCKSQLGKHTLVSYLTYTTLT